ncbi:MAG: HAMP domain-containing histidine kinase [Gammaproteobacteria bacterium]|nr:HAMP domain-containing histidine kinase [Gammaproteobacteria bacterium]
MLSLTAIAALGAEILFVSVTALLLFRFRDAIGLGPLYIFIGTLQYLSVVLASSVYLPVSTDIYVSPGSVVLFAASLFTILLVYLKTDIPTARGLIFGILAANVGLTGLLAITSWQMSMLNVQNFLSVPVQLFAVSPRVFFTGTLLLLVDFVLVVIVYQWLTVRVTVLPLLARILITLMLVLAIDAVLFPTLVFFGDDGYNRMLVGHLVGKLPAGLVYGLILYFYLTYVEQLGQDGRASVSGQMDDVFSLFTYRERYEEVREKLAASQAANEAKSRFLANMSHELRTPLNAIIGFTSVLLKRHDTADEERMLLERVQVNGTHLLELINGLLDLSKIESGRAELNVVTIELSELVTETVHQLQAQAQDKGLELDTDLPDSTVVLDTDRLRLKQVLINLIGNAVKFTNSGGVCVRLSTNGSGRPARLDIEDTGVGIEEEKLETIFSPFYHTSYSSPEVPGVGLGLAISRALCDEMGYRLEVDSKYGKGSNFSIHFSTH